jgi:hypothetical protein
MKQTGSPGRLRYVTLLLVGEFRPPVELVVLVSSALREHRPEQFDVGHDAATALYQT